MPRPLQRAFKGSALLIYLLVRPVSVGSLHRACRIALKKQIQGVLLIRYGLQPFENRLEPLFNGLYGMSIADEGHHQYSDKAQCHFEEA